MTLAGWVPPEAPPPGAAAAPTAGPPARGPSRAPARAARPVPRPVPLRPLTVADVVDGAFAVVKARPVTIIGICATFIVPLVALQALVAPDVLTTGLLDGALAGTEDDATAGIDGTVVVFLLLDSLALPFVAAGIAHVVAAWYAGAELTAPEAVVRVVRRGWVLVVAWTASHLLMAVGFLAAFVGSLLVMALFLVTAPAAAVEGRGPFASLARSARLCRRRLFAVLWLGVLTGAVSTVVAMVLPLLAEAVVALVGDRAGWVLHGAAAIVARLVATPIVAASAVIVYLDLRVRYEGLDLELALADRAA